VPVPRPHAPIAALPAYGAVTMQIQPLGPAMRCVGRVAERPDKRLTQVFAKAHVTFLRVITYLLPRDVPRRHDAPVAMHGVANSDAVGEAAPGRAWPVPAPTASDASNASNASLITPST